MPALDLGAARVLPALSGCLALLPFSAAFGAMLLGNVVFLTGVWSMEPATAGLCGAGTRRRSAHLADVDGTTIGRFGVGPVAAVGAVTYVLGIVCWLVQIRSEPHYGNDFLLGWLATGAGIGLVIPSPSAVTGLALPAPQWRAGSALVNTARQMGAVIGTAVLTMIYRPAANLEAIRHGWVSAARTASAAALIAAPLVFTNRQPRIPKGWYT